MAGTQTLDYPDTTDPLAHATIQRRLWAAYLRAGFNRSSFAEALGVRMQTVWQWDKEQSMPTLEVFKRACQLVGYTMDELAYGHARPEPRSSEPDLSSTSIKALLDAVNASSDQRTALGEHSASPAGMYQRFTRTYVTAFIASYADAVASGQQQRAAIAAAIIAATNARASADALALGVRPVSPERIEEIGASVIAAKGGAKNGGAAKRKRKRKR